MNSLQQNAENKELHAQLSGVSTDDTALPGPAHPTGRPLTAKRAVERLSGKDFDISVISFEPTSIRPNPVIPTGTSTISNTAAFIPVFSFNRPVNRSRNFRIIDSCSGVSNRNIDLIRKRRETG